MPRLSRRSSRRLRAQRLGSNDEERNATCHAQGKVYRGKPVYACRLSKVCKKRGGSRRSGRKSNRLSGGKRAKLNAYMRTMLKAKRSNARSFQYQGKTYVKKIGNNGLILYKKSRSSRRIRGGDESDSHDEFDDYEQEEFET